MKNKQAWRNRLLRITAAGGAWWWQTGLVWAATEKDLAKTGTAGANTAGSTAAAGNTAAGAAAAGGTTVNEAASVGGTAVNGAVAGDAAAKAAQNAPAAGGLLSDPWILIGLGAVLILLLLVILIWTYKLSSRLSRLQQEVDRQHGDQQDDNDQFTGVLDKLDRRLIVTENNLRKLQAAAAAPAAHQPGQAGYAAAPEASALQFTKQPPRESPLDIFIRQYNVLAGVRSGYERKQARDSLKQQYNFQSFSCVNFDERMRMPGVQPVFADSAVGDFWAVKTDRPDIYYVVPNALMTYESQKHNTGGMREVFQSNYREGAYNQIEVIKPALFQKTAMGWICQQAGQIRLR